MCALSNTFTTTIRKPPLLVAIILTLCLISPSLVTAQTNMGTINPLKQSVPKLAKFDMFVYGGGSISKISGIHTANTNYNSNLNNSTIYNSHLDFGLSTDLFYRDMIRFGASLGYGRDRFAFDRGFADNTGVFAHWLTTDLNVSMSIFLIGVNSAVFLNSQIRNDNHFSYDGIYSTCFNPITFSAYYGMLFWVFGIKFEVKLGLYLPPKINPSSLAYYNMQKSSLDRIYWEVRVSFRLFTTARRIQSII